MLFVIILICSSDTNNNLYHSKKIQGAIGITSLLIDNYIRVERHCTVQITEAFHAKELTDWEQSAIKYAHSSTLVEFAHSVDCSVLTIKYPSIFFIVVAFISLFCEHPHWRRMIEPKHPPDASAKISFRASSETLTLHPGLFYYYICETDLLVLLTSASPGKQSTLYFFLWFRFVSVVL